MSRNLAWMFVAIVVLVVFLPTIISGLRTARLHRHGLALPPKPHQDLRRPETHAWYLLTEILLRDPEKVAEGRRQGDLRQRLGDEIDKNRSVFLGHQGSTPAMEALYEETLLEVLAAGDEALL